MGGVASKNNTNVEQICPICQMYVILTSSKDIQPHIPVITSSYPVRLYGAHRDMVNFSCTTFEVSHVASNDVRRL